MITRTARARYEGMGQEGRGWISTQSGVLADRPYGFTSRFKNEAGTNPEELIAASHAGLFHNGLVLRWQRQGSARVNSKPKRG